jgi:hypothetical protein
MSASPPQGLFKPPQQGYNLATLVLIENSPAMVDRWPDLRDHYLPTLLGTVRKVNPIVPVRYSATSHLSTAIERSHLSTSLSVTTDPGSLAHQLSCLYLRRGHR